MRCKLAVVAFAVLLSGAVGCAGESDTALPTSIESTAARTMSPEELESARAEAAARKDPASYPPISARDLALLVRDPDAAKGRKMVLYGVVTQFDAATGKSDFLASVGAEPQERSYDYDQNAWVTTTDPAILANVAEKDLVTMHVEVAGAYTYDTQIGGQTTVPKFWVYIINTTGTTE